MTTHPDARLVLEAARSLLSTPGVWIKGQHSADKHGKLVGHWDSRACRFSLDGALFRAAYVMNRSAGPAYDRLCWCLNRSRTISLAHFNDAQSTELPAVIELLNKAIVQLGGEAINPYGEPDE